MGIVLVIAAHPDDEVLGAGGTMARMSEDNEVYVLILGQGMTSRERAEKEELLKTLRENSREANKTLGVKEVFFEDFPDNMMDSVPLLDIVKVVEKYISRLKPETILTHSLADLNIDHRITHQAVITATRPQDKNPVKKILAFEVLSSTHWNFSGRDFRPNVFFDISDTLEKKVAAMNTYSTEVRDFPHPRSERIIRALSEFRGSQAGARGAEAFELVREIH